MTREGLSKNLDFYLLREIYNSLYEKNYIIKLKNNLFQGEEKMGRRKQFMVTLVMKTYTYVEPVYAINEEKAIKYAKHDMLNTYSCYSVKDIVSITVTRV